METEWKRGDPIPEKYRNVLYAWEGGGYSGCIWEMNFGLVTNEGHWDPFNSTGVNGLDYDRTHDARLRDLAGEFGVTGDPACWFANQTSAARNRAEHEIYGERVFSNPEYYDPKHGIVNRRKAEVEKRVDEILGDVPKRYAEFCRRRDEVDRVWHEDLDELFMEQIKAQAERGPNVHPWDYHGPARDRWETFSLAKDEIKKSCATFCEEYSGSVGLVAAVLDYLAGMGYEVWCTCSDCGEQFQLSNYEKFAHLVDENNYHGDGGVGCIFTRILCERCKEVVDCPQCNEPNLPNPYDKSKEGHEYDHTTYRERFIMKWLGVCEFCAGSFFCKEEYSHWSVDIDDLEATVERGMGQLEKYLENMKEAGRSEEDLERLRKFNVAQLSVEWRHLVNALRDRMEDDVKKFFHDANDWSGERIGTNEEYDYT